MSIPPPDSRILSFGSLDEEMNREGKGGLYLERDFFCWGKIKNWGINWRKKIYFFAGEKISSRGKEGKYLLKENICRRKIFFDDHLQKGGPSGWSFARGQFIRMIICKRPIHSDDHLQEAGLSRGSFARGQSTQMIICKKLVDPDNHLQEAGGSRWSFARDHSILMIICKNVTIKSLNKTSQISQQ